MPTRSDALDRTVAVTDALTRRLLDRPVLPWIWGPGLLGYALARLQSRLGDRRYDDYLLRFCRHHAQTPVRSSDTAAPALVSLELVRAGHDEFSPQIDRALDYLASAPRVGGVLDHLGTSGYARYYPASAWVDTVMMAGVFPALVGAQRRDQALLDQAAALPGALADLLQDEASGLWSHSWWAPAWHSTHGRRFPRRLAWARGNGWVVAALPMIREAIGPDHPAAGRIANLVERTSLALTDRQRPDGSWTTLLTGHPRGYRELSATALIAAGWFDSVSQGVLPPDYTERADAALDAVLGGIHDGSHGPELREISGPTIPLPLLPRLGYLAVPRRPNLPWGVAALVFAVLAAERAAG